MSDKSAADHGATIPGVTAGARFRYIATPEDHLAYAKDQMWKAWAEYTDWRRTFERLEREASDKFESIYRSPATPASTADALSTTDETK